MDTVDPKSHSKFVTCVVLVLLLLLIGIAGLGWLVYSQLGTHADGTRLSVAFPGGAHSLAVRGDLPITLPADLAAAGTRIEQQSFQANDEQILFLRREKHTLSLTIAAGDQAIDTGRLRYFLIDNKGNEVGHGALRPLTRIEAGKSETVEIADPDLPAAARVEIRKLP